MRIAVTAGLLIASSAVFGQAPHVPIKTAICQAEQYIEDNQVKNDHRYLASATWHGESESLHNQCWSITWEVDASPPIMDSQLIVMVCADGTIRHQDSWA
jgi:hypothetical protein